MIYYRQNAVDASTSRVVFYCPEIQAYKEYRVTLSGVVERLAFGFTDRTDWGECGYHVITGTEDIIKYINNEISLDKLSGKV